MKSEDPRTAWEELSVSEQVDAVAGEVAGFIVDRRIPFRRGAPLDHMRRLAGLNAKLTLPLRQGVQDRRPLVLKTLYTLWNITVDDEIDREHATLGLDASLRWLMGSRDPTGSSVAAVEILALMESLVPGKQLRRTDPLSFDLWEAAVGFSYEHVLNRSRALATQFEYCRYSTMTASLKVLLDIDLLFGGFVLEGGAYAKLRQAYDELSCAIKLASDIGTLRREVHEEDSMSLLRILSGAGMSSLAAESRSAEDLVEEALTHKEKVRELAAAHMRRARELFSGVPNLDTRGVLAAAGRVVDVYASGVDPFFD